MKTRFWALAAVLAIAACATTSAPPTPVEGQPDTQLFRVFLSAHVPESHVDEVVAADIESFRAKNGYSKASLLSRRWNAFPSYFDYTVRFTR